MGTLKEDIEQQSEWTAIAFASDNYILDYSIRSLIEVDRFLHRNLKNGKPRRGSRLSKNYGGIVFSISSYLTITLLKNVPEAKLITNNDDPQGEINFTVTLPNGTICWLGQRIIKRIQNGLEDSIYQYAYNLTESFSDEKFDSAFWEISKEDPGTETKRWWVFW